jgi:hypothetical protein
MSGGALVGAEAAYLKGIPDITDRDPLSVWDCCAAGTCAVNIRSMLGFGGESWAGEHIAWLVKLIHCQHFGCQTARSCCELALNPWQHDSSDQANEADWEQGQADCGTANSGGAEAHGQQASYDENQGAVAPQDHVLPTRVIVPRPAGFCHAQQASRAASYAIPAGTLGRTRTPSLLIRRSGQVVQDRPSMVVGWADIPELSTCVGCCSAAWLQSWLQSRRNGADPRPSAFQAERTACSADQVRAWLDVVVCPWQGLAAAVAVIVAVSRPNLLDRTACC